MDYFGTEVTEETLADLLRTAVEHTPVTNNRDLAFDPDAWASGLLDEIAKTPLVAKAIAAFTAMARSGSAEQLRFVAQHDLGRDLLPPDVLLDALDRTTDPTIRASLSRSLSRALRAGRLKYTPRLRNVVGEPGVQDDLLGGIVRHDHGFFLSAVGRIFGTDAPKAKLLAYCAATGLNQAEVQRLRDELAASTLPDDVRAATVEALDDVLAHPATAQNTGAVRW